MNFTVGCFTAILIVVVVALIFIFEPLIIIWCLNQLFYLPIIVNFNTWFSVLFLQCALFGGIRVNWRR